MIVQLSCLEEGTQARFREDVMLGHRWHSNHPPVLAYSINVAPHASTLDSTELDYDVTLLLAQKAARRASKRRMNYD